MNRCPLWPAVLLLAVAELLRALPLGASGGVALWPTPPRQTRRRPAVAPVPGGVPDTAPGAGRQFPTRAARGQVLAPGVRSSQLELVQEQQRLWERNLPCIEHQGI